MTHPSSPRWKRLSAIAWHHPRHGISAELRGRSLVTHVAEAFANRAWLSLRLAPCPTNRGSSLSLHHALLQPVALEGLDGHGSNGRRFEAQPAYGFPAANNQLTMTPAVALASVVASSQALQWQRGARASSDWVSMPSTQAEDHL
ncbi:MAG: hypothetical protein OXF67_01485 [Cyanobacteria bacterium MAG CAR4_bin_6]|nr:hypothetical protein [Cyanobacteria bacterium MAG CAR4_bin_6]